MHRLYLQSDNITCQDSSIARKCFLSSPVGCSKNNLKLIKISFIHPSIQKLKANNLEIISNVQTRKVEIKLQDVYQNFNNSKNKKK